jgi:hypothetical protein
MEPNGQTLRYERKWVSLADGEAKVLSLVQRHPALFREAYPARTVNNVYLDTPGRSDYFDHVQGVAERAKTRIRWYGALRGVIQAPVLERKYKRGLLGGKWSQRLPVFQLNGAPWRVCLEEMLGAPDLPERWRWAVRGREPALVNRYVRRYFLSADGRFRLTLDTALEFMRPGSTPRNLERRTLRDRLRVILELKYGPAEAEDADRITGQFHYRLVRCSKYVLGLEALGFGDSA